MTTSITPLDTNKYIDMMMATFLMKDMGGSHNKTDTWWSPLLRFILMVSIEEIKTTIKYVATTLPTMTKEWFLWLWPLFIALIPSIQIMPSFYKKIQVEVPDILSTSTTVDEQTNSELCMFELEGLETVSNEFYNYMLKYGTFVKSTDNMKLTNEKIICVKETYFNISLPYNKIKLIFNSPIAFTVQHDGDTNSVTEMNCTTVVNEKSSIPTIPYDKITSFLQMLPKNIQEIIFNVKNKLIVDAKHNGIFNDPSFNDKLCYYMNASSSKVTIIDSLSLFRDSFTPHNLVDVISKKCPGIKKQELYYDVFIFLSLNIRGTYINNIFNKKYEQKILNINIYNYNFELQLNLKCTTGRYFDIIDITTVANPDTYLSNLLVWYKNITNVNNANVPQTDTKNTKLSVILTNMDDTVPDVCDNLTKSSLEFVNMLYTKKANKKSDGNNITIYSLSVFHDKITESKPNPEYAEYEEKKKLIIELLKKPEHDPTKPNEPELAKHNTTIDFEANDFVKTHIPPKEITTITTKPRIISTEINKRFKSINRLYLKQKDKKKLVNCLENFHLRKDIMKDLDIQNKFGFALYGEPGCGKTTTVIAIASYLQKNIYYVNLKTIQTNEDLKLVFDYVTKCCSNDGIIIFEDIDCACPIVLKRNENIQELNVANLLETQTDKLTLEYFLNVLQGVLTQDGIIYGITTNHINKLDPAFIRDGRFDVKINMTLCDHFQIQSIYKDFLKREVSIDIINKIPEYTFSPVSIIMRCAEYIVDNTSSDEEILEPFIS